MYKVVLQDMPFRIKAMTVRSYDEGEYFYTIFLNAGLNREQQELAYKHELQHISRNDFTSDLTVDEIERACVYVN